MEDRFLRGRQITFMIYEFFRAHGAILGYSDLLRVTFHGDDVYDFGTTWDEVLLSISQVPSDDILESLYEMCIGESDLLRTELAMDEQGIEQHSQPNYQKFNTMVKRCMDQKIRARKVEARNERIEKWRERHGEKLVSVEKQENAINEKSRDSAQEETIVVSATMDTNVAKQHNRPLLPQNRRLRAAGKNPRKGKLSGSRSPIGKRYQRPCKDYIRGSSCDLWRPPECQHYKTQSGCKFGEKGVFRDKELTVSQTKNQK